jgi:hypothetical protein
MIDIAVYRTPLSLTQAIGFSIAGAGTYHYSQLNNPGKIAPSVIDEKKVDSILRRDDEES